jgi:hypothetical protein
VSGRRKSDDMRMIAQDDEADGEDEQEAGDHF